MDLFGYISSPLPKFNVLKKLNKYEVRKYAPHVRAQVKQSSTSTWTSGDGFRPLAGYIFGRNRQSTKLGMTSPVLTTQSTKIAMTAPVLTTSASEDNKDPSIMSFFMPAEYTSVDQLPVPEDSSVELIGVPETTYAVWSVPGSPSDEFLQSELALLRQQVKEDEDVELISNEPIYARYNSPFTIPWFRTNEILLRVKWLK
jgi:hypothetical protein